MLIFLREWQPLITPVLIFVGWLVIRKNGLHFAKRSEVNGIVKDIQLTLDSILNECKDYWLEDDCFLVEQSFQVHITQKLQKLDEKNKSLEAYDVFVSTDLVVSLRKSISLDFKNTLLDKQNGYNIDTKRKIRLQKYIEISTSVSEFYIHLDKLLCDINQRKKYNIYQPFNGFLFGFLIFLLFYWLS